MSDDYFALEDGLDEAYFLLSFLAGDYIEPEPEPEPDPEPEPAPADREAPLPQSFDIPHLALPLRLDRTGYAVEVEQDSPEHLADRLIAAATTFAGLRDDDPEFGIPEETFRARWVDLDALRSALAASEPDCSYFVGRILSEDDLLRDRLTILIDEVTSYG